MNVRLIYCSRATDKFRASDIYELLEKAVRRNEELGITGILFYGNQNFLQCLEGPRDKVNLLYRVILSDRRHEKITLLEYEEIAERCFADWSMGYVCANDINKELMELYKTKGLFDPFSLKSGYSLGLLLELQQQLIQRHAALAK